MPECIPRDLNTPVLRQKHVVDKDDCIPSMCSVALSSTADYRIEPVVTSLVVMD